MKAAGTSQRNAAKILGIARTTVQRYWNGEYTPDDRKSYPAVVESTEKQAVTEALIKYFEENKDAPKKQQPNAKTAWEAVVRGKFNYGESTIRKLVREIKTKNPEAFIPLDFEPGEVMQVDWCEIKAVIDGYMHKVPVFCAVLPYSYCIFIAVLPNMKMPSFIEGHMMAFEWFGGIPERVFYDNLRTAVLFGSGKNAVKQERFKALEAHYAFDAVFMNADSGNEKGSVENLCGLCRQLAFVPVPNVGSLEELQAHVVSRCADYRQFHKIKERPQPIREMYEQERGALLPLPAKRIETENLTQALVGHDLTFRFETTKFSLPMKYIGKKVTVRAHAYSVEAWSGGTLVHTHVRPFSKGKHQYIPEHYLSILERKPRAIGNAAPLKYGVLPPELETFRQRCTSKDKMEQLVDILLLGRDVDTMKLLEAVDYANKSGIPTYKAVCFYLKLKDESAKTKNSMICDAFAVEHADLAEYDILLYPKGKENTDV